MNKYTNIFTLLLLLAGLSGCSGTSSKADYPGTQEEERRERLGRLTGEGGLLLFNDRNENSSDAGTAGIGINSYLWRATLDTISFMPLASADPFGGVIISEWYEDPEAPGERFKVNVLITSKILRSDALQVSVFKQKNVERSGWKDTSVNASVAHDLESKILTRARELRVQKGG